ncbi:hypothetical protein SAMN02745119_02228 [Trichlorobacter thiogenes]|uniref:Lipoprotein n=1 Tax=Trichlorobacter thiogenes TaxID=115783 RepID=A0A1T4Q489_9BACT|nr:hypothetical protein [Trichlorobacter thiogenes]SJZ98602.1 hypothetical protein SAMN02745119_02228 [Trichlorobacter thiogenes]
MKDSITFFFLIALLMIFGCAGQPSDSQSSLAGTFIGLAGCDRTRLMRVAEKSCAPEECIHHEAGVITPDKVLNALLAADAIGRQRYCQQS